jgi:hypothetical protein
LEINTLTTQIPPKTGDEFRSSRRASSFCPTGGTCCVILVTSHELGKDRIVMTKRTYFVMAMKAMDATENIQTSTLPAS